MENADSEGIAKVVIEELNKLKISPNNMLGTGVDNANVMVGNKKSVFTELKKSVPNLFLIKCVCHSIQLAITNAWKNCMSQKAKF